MYLFDTDLHIITALFIFFEVIMLAFQLPFLMTKGGTMRKYYLILLSLLIIKNIAMGLFPDPNIHFIPLPIQYILTYGAGLVMASYFPYYFYKAYEIKQLKWHATKGIFFFLHISFSLFFAITYFITGDKEQSIDNGLFIPSIYGLVLGYVIYRSIRENTSSTLHKDYVEIISVFLAVIPYAGLAFFAYFRIDQVSEALLTNGGFVIITYLFFKKSVIEVKSDFEKLRRIELNNSSEFASLKDSTSDEFNSASISINVLDPNKSFETKMHVFGLTNREKELVRHLKLGYTNEEIASFMNIQASTVKKHLENIFKKVQVSNRVDLIHKLEYWSV